MPRLRGVPENKIIDDNRFARCTTRPPDLPQTSLTRVRYEKDSTDNKETCIHNVRWFDVLKDVLLNDLLHYIFFCTFPVMLNTVFYVF